jgi:hypothetical protein
MTPDLDELRDVMREHVRSLPDNVDREHDVRLRISRHRRKRAVVGTSGAALLAVAATALAVTWLPTGTDTGTPRPAPVVTSPHDQSLPEYLRGGRLVASKEGTSARGITLTFTPTSEQFGFVLSCSNPELARERRPQGADMAMTSLNGKSALGVSCGTALSTDGDADFGLADHRWVRDYGVVIGQPTTVRFAFDHHGTHPGTRFRIGIYQGVPISEFPFPPLPTRIPALSKAPTTNVSGRKILDSTTNPSDPSGFSYQVRLHHGLTVVTQTAAPGTLRMFVNDRLAWTGRSWDYSLNVAQADLRLAQLGVKPGQLVTIRFEAERYPARSYRYELFDRHVN